MFPGKTATILENAPCMSLHCQLSDRLSIIRAKPGLWNVDFLLSFELVLIDRWFSNNKSFHHCFESIITAASCKYLLWSWNNIDIILENCVEIRYMKIVELRLVWEHQEWRPLSCESSRKTDPFFSDQMLTVLKVNLFAFPLIWSGSAGSSAWRSFPGFWHLTIYGQIQALISRKCNLFCGVFVLICSGNNWRILQRAAGVVIWMVSQKNIQLTALHWTWNRFEFSSSKCNFNKRNTFVLWSMSWFRSWRFRSGDSGYVTCSCGVTRLATAVHSDI